MSQLCSRCNEFEALESHSASNKPNAAAPSASRPNAAAYQSNAAARAASRPNAAANQPNAAGPAANQPDKTVLSTEQVCFMQKGVQDLINSTFLEQPASWQPLGLSHANMDRMICFEIPLGKNHWRARYF